MTREELKRLIEPSQDGAGFENSDDPLTIYILNAIKVSADTQEFFDRMSYGIDQLTKAREELPRGYNRLEAP